MQHHCAGPEPFPGHRGGVARLDDEPQLGELTMGISGKFRKTARHTVAGGDGAPNREDSMGAVRRLASIPAGRWGKWAVLVFWVAVFAVAGPLAGKLNSAQQN